MFKGFGCLNLIKLAFIPLTLSIFTAQCYAYTIGISLTTQNNERMYVEGPKIDKALRDRGYNTMLYYSGDGDAKLQKQHIERFIANKVDLMIITPVDAVSISDVVQKAIDQNIKVVALNSMLATDKETAFVGFDNYKIGRMLGNLLKVNFDPKKAKKPYVIGMLLGDKQDVATRETYEGFMSVVGDFFNAGTYRTVGGDFSYVGNSIPQASTEVAYMVVYEAIEKFKQNPNNKLDVIVSSSDAMALAAHQALEKHGLKEEDMPFIIGTDASAEGAYMLKNRHMQYTAFKNYKALTNRLVSIVDEIKESGEKEIKFTSNRMVAFADKYPPIKSYILDSTIINQANWKGTLLDSSYYSEYEVDEIDEKYKIYNLR